MVGGVYGGGGLIIVVHKKMEVRLYLTWEEDIFQTKSTHMLIFFFELLKT